MSDKADYLKDPEARATFERIRARREAIGPVKIAEPTFTRTDITFAVIAGFGLGVAFTVFVWRVVG